MNHQPKTVNEVFLESCDVNLKNLATSPTFAMSLGAKELFHTNFLAFLLESQDKSIEPIQEKLKELLFGHCRIGRVITWREKSNLDLVIMPAPKENINSAELCIATEYKHPDINCKCPIDYCDTIAVVIEAKLKSIPTQEQLDGYDEKLIKGIGFELDDVDTVDASEKNGKRIWRVMRLKLFANGGMESCNTECTIEARGEKTDGKSAEGNTCKISLFKGVVRRILLSPECQETTGSDAPTLKKEIGCWEQMSWQCVVDALMCDRQDETCEPLTETNQHRNCKETELLPRTVCDYRDSLEHILSILKHTSDYVKLSVAKPPIFTYGEYYKTITDKQFKSYRIHDLVGKYASHILELHVKKLVCTALANTGGNGINCESCASAICQQPQAPSFKLCDFEFKLNSYTFFSNQQPGVAFEWLATRKNSGRKKVQKVSFGVQIQNNDYRHFIEVSGVQDVNILTALENKLGKGKNGWFLNGQFFNLKSIIFNVKKCLNGDIEKFYVFGENAFRYSKSDISSLPMTDLAQAVCCSLCQSRQIVSRSDVDCESIKVFLNDSTSK